MRLLDLSPRWLEFNGNSHAILLFRCPHCQDQWLSCTLVAIPIKDQWRLLREALPDEYEQGKVVHCQYLAWSATGVPDFSVLEIQPSIDASKAGHWHGFIRGGEVVT